MKAFGYISLFMCLYVLARMISNMAPTGFQVDVALWFGIAITIAISFAALFNGDLD